MDKKNSQNSCPKVYILIINYNNWEDTIECLYSLFQNEYKNYQIILIDNHSQNNSVEYIRAWLERKNYAHPLPSLSHTLEQDMPYLLYQIEEKDDGYKFTLLENKIPATVEPNDSKSLPLILIATKTNLGFAEGNNVGLLYVLQQNDFDYVWILNNDTVVEKRSLIEMLQVFEQCPSAGIVGSKLIYYSSGEIQAYGGTKKITWINAGSGKYITKLPINHHLPYLRIPGYIIGASMLVKREVFDKIGLLDKNYFMWNEESDFCFRVIKNGYELFCACNSIVYHKEGASTGKQKSSKFLLFSKQRPSFIRFVITTYLDIRNHIYFNKKHFGNFYAFVYLVIRIPNILKKILGVLLFDEDKTRRLSLIAKSIKDGFQGTMGKPKEIP
ncbi:MAG: glycosyltransferase family 2 protein [Brevinematales bacterium]|nr:glycosyltransferase family 2 protein [Brevinematales bacterium]